ncbi:DUF2510 domain-containing protein [Arthrobacter sp. NicSoilB11]|jgi:hypothetical protein|uniref:DUF2510 domain-containing protein n=1 Tax=Arthrobacter sp. NicSoilB11 TaxID=2830999 RepID=UPI001CC61003|nr:DUF2510 domain-containing protein [Arthrobacter sp. NicSoilB11]BCW75913.1 hypothetical protein NicSoilB11_22380 [Arthrobacter sp. NicSoilB11]
MGKMKGNRLNTAANVGSFITGRQQLNVQRTIAQQTAVQAQLAAVQLAQLQRQQLDAEYQRMRAWADAEVSAGRLSQADAEMQVTTHMHNLVSPPPKASDRITARFTEFLIAGLNAGGAAAGWYNQGDGSARYWDGRMWTHHVTSLQVARQLVQRLSDENYKGRRQEVGQADHGTLEGSSATHISTPTPGPVQLPQQPALPPAGWYPTATPGVLGYWDGQAWTGESRPDPNSFPG